MPPKPTPDSDVPPTCIHMAGPDWRDHPEGMEDGWFEVWQDDADHVDGYDRDDLGESPDY